MTGREESDGTPTWEAVFERAPDGVTVVDVREALAARRER